jgi:hypothetical protein
MKTIIENVNGAALLAAHVFAANKDRRHYLEGVHVGVKGGAVVITGTDGHALMQARSPDARVVDDEAMPAAGIILKLNKPPASLAKCSYCEVVQLSATQAIVNTGREAVPAEIVAGNYPNVDTVTASAIRAYNNEQASPADFNPEILQRFVKAGGYYARKPNIKVHQRGNSAAVVAIAGNDELWGIAMPLRALETPPPDWAA